MKEMKEKEREGDKGEGEKEMKEKEREGDKVEGERRG